MDHCGWCSSTVSFHFPFESHQKNKYHCHHVHIFLLLFRCRFTSGDVIPSFIKIKKVFHLASLYFNWKVCSCFPPLFNSLVHVDHSASMSLSLKIIDNVCLTLRFTHNPLTHTIPMMVDLINGQNKFSVLQFSIRNVTQFRRKHELCSLHQ